MNYTDPEFANIAMNYTDPEFVNVTMNYTDPESVNVTMNYTDPEFANVTMNYIDMGECEGLHTCPKTSQPILSVGDPKRGEVVLRENFFTEFCR
jgi:malic enzyme